MSQLLRADLLALAKQMASIADEYLDRFRKEYGETTELQRARDGLQIAREMIERMFSD